MENWLPAQEFVIGGYVPGAYGFDSLVIGSIGTATCTTLPACALALFQPPAARYLNKSASGEVSLRESSREAGGPLVAGSYGREDEKSIWLKPEAVANFEFLEWTDADHLRHTKFVGMRDDKDPRKLGKET